MESIRQIVREVLNEVDYNYHQSRHGDLSLDNISPHGSDNIVRMSGRDTGHFGSGLYFSTFNCKDWGEENYEKNYGKYSDDSRPEIINVKKGVYRVDFDIYKNLYRVDSIEHGDILFDLLKLINDSFYGFEMYVKKYNKLPDWLRSRYLKIDHGLKTIGLKLPKYKEFINMFNSGAGDYKGALFSQDVKSVKSRASMSTRIMEWNGYNGVNVGGIPKYDSTLHGSVIYDMSKVDSEFREAKYPDMSCDVEKGVYGDFMDVKTKILRGEDIFDRYIEKFNNLDKNIQLVFMKEMTKYLFDDELNSLSDYGKEIYFKTLSPKIKSGKMKNKPNVSDIIGLIDYGFINTIYDINSKVDDNTTMLEYIFSELYALISIKNKKYLKRIIDNVPRELTEEEKENYDYIKDYYI